MKAIRELSDYEMYKSNKPPTKLLIYGYILLLIGCAASFSSCMTQKKAERYFNEHPEQAARYCSEKFPLKPSTITEFIRVDSSGYEEAYQDLLKFSDSLLLKLDSSQKAGSSKIEQSFVLNPNNVHKNEQGNSGASVKMNVDSLRVAIEKRIRKALRPCVDSIHEVTKIVPDSAKVFYLESQIKKYVADAEYQKSRGDRNGKQRNWMIVVIVVLLAYIFRKRLLGLINPVTKFWPFIVAIWLTSCGVPKQIQVGFENVRVVAIDTVTRWPSEKQLLITLKSDRRIEYFAFADVLCQFFLGTNYLMVVRKTP